ncbi:MAG TPA: hypothetical protein VLL97_09225, partial [Acidobacteriota bacterium]|nr:hypothetical protein [Acidobacteriota bacterium]
MTGMFRMCVFPLTLFILIELCGRNAAGAERERAQFPGIINLYPISASRKKSISFNFSKLTCKNPNSESAIIPDSEVEPKNWAKIGFKGSWFAKKNPTSAKLEKHTPGSSQIRDSGFPAHP